MSLFRRESSTAARSDLRAPSTPPIDANVPAHLETATFALG